MAWTPVACVLKRPQKSIRVPRHAPLKAKNTSGETAFNPSILTIIQRKRISLIIKSISMERHLPAVGVLWQGIVWLGRLQDKRNCHRWAHQCHHGYGGIGHLGSLDGRNATSEHDDSGGGGDGFLWWRAAVGVTRREDAPQGIACQLLGKLAFYLSVAPLGLEMLNIVVPSHDLCERTWRMSQNTHQKRKE